MGVYRFKISFEEHEDISREIEIKSSQTFEDLHFAIQAAIGFDALQPASFYMSNDHWMKGQEISLDVRPARNGEKNVLMKDAVLLDWIVDPHQKIYYEFDYTSSWSFFIELTRIFPLEDERKKYPVCVKIAGEAPKQRAVIIPVKADDLGLEEAILADDYIDEEEETEDGELTVVDEDEADEITEEGMMEEGPPEE